jgi:regulatory protein
VLFAGGKQGLPGHPGPSLSGHLSLTGMQFKKNLTPEQALQKLRQYCGYQERCHQEVKEKLFSLAVKKQEHDQIIATLIEENYLNEERFAIAFAGGKFRIKEWGKVKIRHELRQREVSEYCIKKALQQIDTDQYLEVLHKLAASRYESIKDTEPLIKRKKTWDYLVGKGYEVELIKKVIPGN